MNRFDKLNGNRVRYTTASVIIASCLFGFTSASSAGNNLPTRVPPSSGGNGHASAKFRVAITVLPAPAASKVTLGPRSVAALHETVEQFSGYAVRTTVIDRHIAMDVD